MRIQFCKHSDTQHQVSITRADGTEESRSLDSRSFLFHDIAHLALELELPLANGFWGSVANGASLSGSDCHGADVVKAEALAGPIQKLVKNDAPASSYIPILERLIPDHSNLDRLSSSIHERVRQLKGHWRATHFGKCMEIEWPD